MGLSDYFQDNKPYSSPSVRGCVRGISSCMFYSNGSCTAVSCVWNELPEASAASRTIKCISCGEEVSISPYQGGTFYLCDRCSKKLNNFLNGHCMVCGTSLGDNEGGICKRCGEELNKVRELKNDVKDIKKIVPLADDVIKIKNLLNARSCPICGASISNTESICSSCAARIRAKLEE